MFNHSAPEHEKSLGVSDDGAAKGFSRNRPWLSPSNRKLRHLQGISLRNLSLSSPTSRPRGKTIDDESLPYARKTPAKIFAQREAPKLEHSRSSNDLKLPSDKAVLSQVREDCDDRPLQKPRPPNGKLRRRSTLNWANAPPRVRQSNLEDVARERMADTWFSLHCSNVQGPIYVSEIVDRAMNPNFRFFDLNVYGPAVTRQDGLIFRFWAKAGSMEGFTLLIEIQLCLRSLQFIGKSLENFHHPLPQNCVLFHLSDGIYTSFTDLPLEEPVLAIPNASNQSSAIQSTSSFDALMRLSDLDDCIQDALVTRENLALQISRLIDNQKQSLDTVNASCQAGERLSTINSSLAMTRKSSRAIQDKSWELQASLATRRATMFSGSINGAESQTRRSSAQADFIKCKALRQETKQALTGQIRRACEDLLQIYPIEPYEQKPLCFTIRGLHLPNAASASSTEADPAVTAAALGYIAHVVHLLSLYLLTPIPYPPSLHGSTSTILDPVSANMPSTAARTFPLYQKGAVAYRFEYGVFLLNSDVELLMSRQGSRMVDLRHTLPNLKYLLTVLATGKGELPSRKKDEAKVKVNGSVPSGRITNGGAQRLGKGLRADKKLLESQTLKDDSMA